MIDLNKYESNGSAILLKDLAIWEQLKRIADALENFNFEQVGEYKHASTKPKDDEDPFDYVAIRDTPWKG